MSQHQEQLEEVQIAFNLYELLSQLECLLRESYFDQFNQIMAGLEKARGMDKHFPS